MATFISSPATDRILAGLRAGSFRNIVVLTGAGISTASGIPDFRSPGGLYATLQADSLTASPQEKQYLKKDPTGVVDIRIFAQNQFPYLEVRRPFILGTADQKWKYTLAHAFIGLLHDKKLLRRHYDQNIDGLSHQVDVEPSKIINVHGSLQHVYCEACKAPYPLAEFREAVRTKIKNIYGEASEFANAPAESEHIKCLQCSRPAVKPATVLFGRSLPDAFHEGVEKDFNTQENIDLLIVAGTSLKVHPSAGLVDMLPASVPRLVINLEPVGEDLVIDYSPDNARDGFLKGYCDESVLKLLEALGWKDELAAKYAAGMCDKSRATLLGDK